MIKNLFCQQNTLLMKNNLSYQNTSQSIIWLERYTVFEMCCIFISKVKIEYDCLYGTNVTLNYITLNHLINSFTLKRLRYLEPHKHTREKWERNWAVGRTIACTAQIVRMVISKRYMPTSFHTEALQNDLLGCIHVALI